MESDIIEDALIGAREVINLLPEHPSPGVTAERATALERIEAALIKHFAPSEFLPMERWDQRDEAVLLLVDYTDGDHAIDDATIAITIGHNNDHNVGDDEGQGWLFAGWCRSHDHYVQGKGKPIGWLPLPHHLARAAEAAAEAAT